MITCTSLFLHQSIVIQIIVFALYCTFKSASSLHCPAAISTRTNEYSCPRMYYLYSSSSSTAPPPVPLLIPHQNRLLAKKYNRDCTQGDRKGRHHDKLTVTSRRLSVLSSSATTTTIGSAVLPNVMTSIRNVLSKNTQIFLWNDPNYILAAVVAIANFGIFLEQKTKVGKQLSATLATMFLSMVCANLGIIPYTSPIYSMVNKYLVPLAVSLLLFDSDLRRVIRDTGSLIIAFFVGALATLVGTVVSFPLIPMKSIGTDGWKVASALTARHIGGGINFIAVAETLGISASTISAALAADNVVVALYFAYLFASSKEGKDDDIDSTDVAILNNEDLKCSEAASTGSSSTGISMSSLGTSLSIATLLLFVSSISSEWFLPKGTSVLPVISLYTVAAATAFPKFFATLSNTGTALGVLFVQMFFAASGAAGSIVTVLSKAPSILIFSAVQIFVHYITLMGLGKYLLGLQDRELYIASNANVGGPTTAASMASAKKWPRLIMPGLLVGILGYAIATPVSLALGKYILLRFV